MNTESTSYLNYGFAFLIYILPFLLQAQDQDSLKEALNRVNTTEQKVEIALKLAELNIKTDSAATVKYLNNALVLSSDLDNRVFKIKTLRWYGKFMYSNSKITEAIAYANDGEKLAEESGNAMEQALLLRDLGQYYTMAKKYKEAINNSEHAFDIFIDLSDSVRAAATLNNLGIIQSYQGLYRNALEYYFEVLNNYKVIDSLEYSSVLGNIGIAYMELKEFDLSLNYLKRSLEIMDKIGFHMGKFMSYGNIGLNYLEIQQYDSAIHYLEKSAQNMLKLNNGSVFPDTYIYLATGYIGKKQYKNAFESLEKAKSILDNSNNKIYTIQYHLSKARLHIELNEYEVAQQELDQISMDIEDGEISGFSSEYYRYSADIASAMSHYAKSNEYLNKLIHVKDSIFNRERVKEIANLEANFRFKEEMDSVTFAQRAEKMVYEARIEEQKDRTVLLTIFISIISVISIFLIYYLIKTKKLNDSLAFSNSKILEQNVSINRQKEELEIRNKQLDLSIEELQGAQKRLIEKEKLSSVGQLASGLAHELNNSLSVIGNVNVVLKESLMPELNKSNSDHIKMINLSEKSIQKASAIITSLKHATSELNEEHVTKMSLVSLVKENVEFVKIDNANIEFVEEYGHDMRINLDRSEFSLGLIALLRNAIDAIGKGEKSIITVSIKKDEGVTKIEIEDTGNGIPGKNLNKIFDPFFTTKPPGAGVGLGLFLSKSIFNKMGADLTITSKVNFGTKASITFS